MGRQVRGGGGRIGGPLLADAPIGNTGGGGGLISKSMLINRVGGGVLGGQGVSDVDEADVDPAYDIITTESC